MNERLIGLMSGTSLDGVDAVLVRFDEQGAPSVEADHFLAYPPRLREQALALQARGDNELDRAARLANELAELYAQAVNGLLAARARAGGHRRRRLPRPDHTPRAGRRLHLAGRQYGPPRRIDQHRCDRRLPQSRPGRRRPGAPWCRPFTKRYSARRGKAA